MDATTLVRAIDWGDAPTWLATFGAFVAVFFASRALRVEHRRDMERLEADEAQQPSSIAEWGFEKFYFEPGLTGSFSTIGGWREGLRVRNASDAPIYGVTVGLVRVGELAPRECIHLEIM